MKRSGFLTSMAALCTLMAPTFSMAMGAATVPGGGMTTNSVGATATVYNITVTVYGTVYFWQSGAARQVPSCAAAMPTRWAFSASSPSGQAVLALLLSANATGRRVVVAGNNTCDVTGDTESVSYIYIADN